MDTVWWASWPPFQARFPALGQPQARIGGGEGGHKLLAGQTSQLPRLGCLATNFLLGPLRPRGASKSFLLLLLPSSLLIHSGTEASIQDLQKCPLYTQPEGSFRTSAQPTPLPC